MSEAKATNNLIKTPVHRIPIGQPLRGPDGRYALRLKKAGSPEIEDIPIDELVALVVSNATEVPSAETPMTRDSLP